MYTPLSAVVIAKNEERTIGKCLDALRRVSDDIILVLDTLSTDHTQGIASQKQVRIMPFDWQGYSAGKNYGASLARYDWILCLDADEVLDETLISQLTSLQAAQNSYFLMNIQTWFGNVAVRHSGWYPDWNIRLYNRTTMQWSHDFVHEELIANQDLQPVKMRGKINHFSFANEAHMKEKYLYYARLRAAEWVRSQSSPPWYKWFAGPAFRFFRTFILKRGFLDGSTGYLIAKNEYILKKNELRFFRQLLASGAH